MSNRVFLLYFSERLSTLACTATTPWPFWGGTPQSGSSQTWLPFSQGEKQKHLRKKHRVQCQCDTCFFLQTQMIFAPFASIMKTFALISAEKGRRRNKNCGVPVSIRDGKFSVHGELLFSFLSAHSISHSSNNKNTLRRLRLFENRSTLAIPKC